MFGVPRLKTQPLPPYDLAAFGKFCRSLVLENGRRMRVEAHERILLGGYFAGVLETVAILPKKNGKTTLLAALALFHLRSRPAANVVIAASSRDQATILFRQAQGLVKRSGLEDLFKVQAGYRRVVGQGGASGTIRVLAGDVDTGDGELPDLALVDELHRHRNGDLYGVLRDGIDARDGRMVTISTAGATMASALGTLRTKAHELPGFTRDEATKYNHVRSEDGAFEMHEWCLSDTDDPEDLALVKLANPASWQTVEKLSRRRESPSMTPWRWLRFACGVWTEGEEPWIEPARWDSLADPELEIEEGATVWLDVDVAQRREAAQIAIVAKVDEELWAKVEMFRSVTFEFLEERVRELSKLYDVAEVAFDSRTFYRSAEVLQNEGFPMVDFPQSQERLTLASASLYKLIEEGRLRHDGDKELRAQVLAGRVKEDERGWRFVKDPNLPRPIGGLIALAVACHLASEDYGSTPQIAVLDF